MTMKRVQTCIAAVVFMICAIDTNRQSEAAVDMHEGEWETTMEMKMEGMPKAMPPIKRKQCITKDNMIPQHRQGNKNCKVKSQKLVGNKLTWTAECVDRGSKTEMQGEITYSGDSYRGNITVREKGTSRQVMVSTGVLSGHRIGECTDKTKH